MKNDKFDMYGMDEVEYYHAMEKARYLEELIAPNISEEHTAPKSKHEEGKNSASSNRKE